jgi:sterol desaturase/sphingolipid hydroxylase (fatty acid hydroxylase superfamily)
MGLLPRIAVIAAIVVAMDAANWFVHLANHRVRVLWRFHELHHSQEDMNVLTVFRTHPLIHVSYLLAVLPVVVILANGAVPITNLGFGPLRRVLVSPNYHRIHHRREGPQDVNLGFVLTVWDQLSHRAIFPTAETIGIDTGLPGRPLRVEQEGPRARHLAAFRAQLAGPFRPMRQPLDLPSVHTRTLASDREGAFP